MPKIHLNQRTQTQLDLLIQEEIKAKVKGKRGKELTLAIVELSRQRYGVSYNSIISKLLDEHKKK